MLLFNFFGNLRAEKRRQLCNPQSFIYYYSKMESLTTNYSAEEKKVGFLDFKKINWSGHERYKQLPKN